jgi:hypothetical protein
MQLSPSFTFHHPSSNTFLVDDPLALFPLLSHAHSGQNDAIDRPVFLAESAGTAALSTLCINSQVPGLLQTMLPPAPAPMPETHLDAIQTQSITLAGGICIVFNQNKVPTQFEKEPSGS